MNHRLPTIGSVVLLVAGCVASGVPSVHQAPSAIPTAASPSVSDVAGIIPWSSELPAPPLTPSATPIPDAASCKADQLGAGNAGWGGATGSLFGGFLVWNTGEAPCVVEGDPTIAIVDAPGRSLKIDHATAPSPAAQRVVLRPRQSAPALNQESPTGLASDTFQWSNWCAPAPKSPLTLAVTLPESPSLRLPIIFAGGETSAPRCDDTAAPSTMTVSPFEETPGPSLTEPPAVPAEALRLALEVPDHGTAGNALDYIAALTNPSTAAISLDPCPAYRESLVTPGGQIALDYLLNCAAVPSIGPGETVRFAIVLEIPRSQPPTTQATIVWELDPYYSEGFLARSPAQKVALGIIAP
ncbi:MAG TPA: DUF4232 domain-containing protein [Candidatus Bathyarchaeia archaeon]|nr:DUF4232 domain-containing protein [Candidatus Bathyarchaeia archaeon]